MENTWSWEQKAIISELIQGLQLAKQLKLLNSTTSTDTRQILVHRILASFEKSLLILNRSVPAGHLQPQPHSSRPGSSLPESPISVNGSPPTGNFDKGAKENLSLQEVSKKRKKTDQRIEHVRVSSQNGLEGPHEDGYSWRKYGQKDILGAKYPRSYYRCTYRHTRNCCATKQVQRSEDEPMIFEITYKGEHTCFQATNLIPAPESPDKQEQIQSDSLFSNFRANLQVNTKDLEDKEMIYPFNFPSTSVGHMKIQNHSLLRSMIESNNLFDPSLLAPTTPEPDHLLQWQTNSFLADHNFRCADSELTENMSAKTSTTNSPMPELDLSLDLEELEPSFRFETSRYFS